MDHFVRDAEARVMPSTSSAVLLQGITFGDVGTRPELTTCLLITCLGVDRMGF